MALCMAYFFIYSLHYGLMEADLRISIKDCRHNEKLETGLVPSGWSPPVSALGPGRLISSQVGKELAHTGFDGHNVL